MMARETVRAGRRKSKGSDAGETVGQGGNRADTGETVGQGDKRTDTGGRMQMKEARRGSVMNVTMEKQDLLEVIDRVVRRTMQMDMTWEWPCGVAFYGVSRAYETTGNREYIDYLKKYVDEYIEIGLPKFMVNVVSMGHCLITLYEATGDEKYWNIVLEKAKYLREEAVRFGDGVFQHTVSAKNDFPEQAWADTLFMAAYFLLRVGIKTGDKACVDDALKQYYWHEEYLQDNTTNLYYHAWDNIRQDHLSGIHWARANAWAAYTMAQALQHINYMYPMFMRIEGSLRDQLSALVRVQAEDGMWHTVLDDPETYEETSAAAGIGAALAMYGNPLHRKAVAKALEGVLANIGADGSVWNVSAGTAVMATKEDYNLVPHKRIMGWGQGLTLAFLCAVADRV